MTHNTISSTIYKNICDLQQPINFTSINEKFIPSFYYYFKHFIIILSLFPKKPGINICSRNLIEKSGWKSYCLSRMKKSKEIFIYNFTLMWCFVQKKKHEKTWQRAIFTKGNTPPFVFSRFLNCTIGTKSRRASHTTHSMRMTLQSMKKLYENYLPSF